MELRDQIKRELAIINKAQQNEVVNEQMRQYYTKLYSLLVKSDKDQDIFNDTYLNLTKTYKPNRPFDIEFARQFRNLKIEFREKSIKFVPYADISKSEEDQELVD